MIAHIDISGNVHIQSTSDLKIDAMIGPVGSMKDGDHSAT